MNDTGFKFEAFPEELQIYILSRLPPESLSRCKCVSEHWNTTLTIQAFLFRQSHSYDKHSKLAFVVHKATPGYDSVLSFEVCNKNTPNRNRKTMTTVPKTRKMRVENSMTTEELIKGHHERFAKGLFCKHMSNICNDLICVINRLSPLVYLLNIKTRDFIQLPAVTTQKLGCIRYWYALGFDPVNKVYKVLSIYGGSKVGPTKAAIFTLGSSKHWKPVEYKFLRCAVAMKWGDWKYNNRFCLDGVIYWVNDYKIYGTRVLTVVAFDLNHEVFTEYKLDTIPIKDDEKIVRYYYLTSLKGHPSLFIWNKESDEIQQWKLFNHTYPKVTWYRRSFTAHDFPKNFPYGRPGTFFAGGSILLQSVRPIITSVEPKEQDKSLVSWYKWSDLENFDL